MAVQIKTCMCAFFEKRGNYFLNFPPSLPPFRLPFPQTFRFKVSYLEIYNEQLRDLLCPQTHPSKIQVG
jgi:hypothetical protein